MPREGQNFYDVIQTGVTVPGDDGTTGNPVWLDTTKIKRAKQLYHQHFASILFSHLLGLTFLVTIPSIFKTLTLTGKSSNTVLLFRRYIKTLSQIRKWYEDDIVNPRSEARESIRRVRQQHYRVASTSSKDGQVHVSQHDMAMTQFAFLGFMVLYPDKMGVWCTQDDIQCLAHFWRYVSYLLGTEDRFNLVTDDWQQTLNNCRTVSKEVYANSVQNATPEAIRMSQGIVEAMSSFLRILRWRAMVCYQLNAMNIPSHIKMDLIDWLGYFAGHFVYGFLLKFTIVRWMHNSLVKYLIDNATKYGDFYEAKLAYDKENCRPSFFERLRLKLMALKLTVFRKSPTTG